MRLLPALLICAAAVLPETQPAAGRRFPQAAAPRPAASRSAALPAVGRRPAFPAVTALKQLITHEMRDKHLPALSIALVDDQQIVWAKGFGYARPSDSTPATANTIYRVGSVSKLFTDIAVMQLVERGKVSLDAPVSKYLPHFAPRNPYGTPITLRELMSHRAGLVREPPVGSYFDASSPSLEATVHSLNETALVYEPHTRAKYSNAGIAVVGRVLEVTQHTPFARYLSRAVLRPIGLTHSAFARESSFTRDLASAYMWTYDGRTFPAPTFELGMAPAGSMYTSVMDLGRFLTVLFAGGRGPHGRVLQRKTLDAMWRPQFAHPGDRTGYGLGFTLSNLDGHRLVGHAGASYGFATQLEALPDDKLGVVVVTTEDGANAVTSHIATAALRLLLAERERHPLPAFDTTIAVPPDVARQMAGRYGTGDSAVDLVERNGTLTLEPVRGGVHTALRMLRDTLVVDDRLGFGTRIQRATNAIVIGADTLRRRTMPMPQPAPAEWHGLIGEYGWEYNTLYILEKDGRLQALIEWFFEYPLEAQSADSYRFPRWGLYDNEAVTFTRDAFGRATAVRVGAVTFPRRATGPDDGSQFRITPVRPLAELRAWALAAAPPHERGDFRPSDLVELVTLDTSIHLDIRYATANNFLGTPMYQQARAFLQRPAALAVVRASQWLHERGYGLLIHDAYRPWFVTKMFWDATPVDKHVFVADPSQGSRHNRGCAVDLTLYDLTTGKPIVMTGGYDEMTDRSYADYPAGTSLQRWHRALLRQAMEMQGFTVYNAEWWHFDYGEWREYGIGNVAFDGIGTERR